MSNAWLNIRVGNYHLILGENGFFSARWSRNDYHKDNPVRFEIYTLKPFVR
jgi:hypothetical protein